MALNAGVLAAAQAVEHYEIARYGSLREWAKVLGHDEAHELLWASSTRRRRPTTSSPTSPSLTINKAAA